MRIDFVSTQQPHSQAAACARLLAAVIKQAVADACTPVSKAEQNANRNLNEDARTAIIFLFSKESPFELYADLIGLDAQRFRIALLAAGDPYKRPSDSAKQAYPDDMRRVVRWRRRAGAKDVAAHGAAHGPA